VPGPRDRAIFNSSYLRKLCTALYTMAVCRCAIGRRHGKCPLQHDIDLDQTIVAAVLISHRRQVRWPECPSSGGFCDLRLRTDLQFLQQALPLFADLIGSSADLRGNGMVRVASG